MIHQWVDCSRDSIAQRYDRLADFTPFFDRLFFLPPHLRRDAVKQLGLRRGDSVLDIGCGTGVNLRYLQEAVGPAGHIFGVDISPGMLRKAHNRCVAKGWRNVELSQGDIADYIAPRPLDGVLFSLCYNTMPQHHSVLRKMWQQLRPGGRLVIMDAKLPPGLAGRLLVPFSLWLMKRTMLSNPFIQPWKELAAIAEQFEMREFLFGSYYICRGIKRVAVTPAAVDKDHRTSIAPEYRIAAEYSGCRSSPVPDLLVRSLLYSYQPFPFSAGREAIDIGQACASIGDRMVTPDRAERGGIVSRRIVRHRQEPRFSCVGGLSAWLPQDRHFD